MNMPIAPAAAGTITNPMTAGASPAAASPLGGFEALLAALFAGEGAQVVSPLAKSAQPGEGETSAEGAADQEALGADSAAAQTLLSAFAMVSTPAAPVAAQPAEQGEGAAASSAAVPNVLPLTTQAVPAEGVLAEGLPQEAASTPTQADPKASMLAPPAGPSANAPGQGPATAQAAANVLPTVGEAAPQDSLADPALQAVKADPAAAPSNQSAAQAMTGSPALQHAAAHLPAQKPVARQGQTPDAQSSVPAVEDVADPEAPTGVEALAPKTPGAAEATPGVRKLERAEAQAQPAAPQADAAPLTTHAPAASEAAAGGASATSHAAPAHAASTRGAPETVATLAAEILKKLDSRTTRFDMELEPHGLGKVDVRLEIGAHGRLTAAMAFENPQSAQELKNRSGELVRALEQAGFDVSDGLSFDVADNSNGSGQNNNGAQEQAQDAPWRGRAFLSALQTAGAADAPPIAPMNLARLRASGVDIKI